MKGQGRSEVSSIVLFRLHNLLIENRVEKEESHILKYNTFDGLETDRQFVLPESQGQTSTDMVDVTSKNITLTADEDADEF